ncbi:unnamed protein product, partial [Amoebophrya sp. A25]
PGTREKYSATYWRCRYFKATPAPSFLASSFGFCKGKSHQRCSGRVVDLGQLIHGARETKGTRALRTWSSS